MLGGIAADHKTGHRRLNLACSLQGLQSIHPFHADVGYHQVEVAMTGFLHGLLARGDRHDLITLIGQDIQHGFAQVGIVFDQ